MSYVVFRFDIDSHVCMKQGVPILLDVSKKYDVPFTFFLNAGRAVSVWDTLSAILKKDKNNDSYNMLTAYQKLGGKQYFYAAVRNPKMIKYKKQIQDLLASGNEIGLHGGMNHGVWYAHAQQWNEQKTEQEIEKAIKAVRKICPAFMPKGFASPGFVTPRGLEGILEKLDFTYFSDVHALGEREVIKRQQGIASAAVNLCGEPGGIAFWENNIALGFTDEDILQKFMDFVNTHKKVVVFDHPYVAALKMRENLERIIIRLKEGGHCIIPLHQLVEMESG